MEPGDDVTFASFSTDGVDGHSDLAGAVADRETLKLARSQGLDYKNYLASYDSATFFKKLGLDIKTGPSGTNVADITLVLITNPRSPGPEDRRHLRRRGDGECQPAGGPETRLRRQEHPSCPAGGRKTGQTE